MAQTAVPISTDDNTGAYVDEGGGSTDLHLKIDETVAAANDSEFIESPAAPSNAPITFSVTSLTDPESSSSHILRARVAKDQAAGAQIDATIELREAYVSEASQGTLIATLSETNVGDAFATITLTLSGAEADAITDYTSLDVRVVANQV